MKRTYYVALLIFLVLLIDQALKIYIKLNFEYNEDVPMMGAQWARLHFVENEGMAFGITFDWPYGKLALSLFRILMVVGLIWYIRMLANAGASLGLLCSIGLITAGALGNIIDSAFYGILFSESPLFGHGGTATWASPEHPAYGTFLHGKVVDMFYFPIKHFQIPEWVPSIGGEEWLFFSPIFNVADAAITCGVISLLLFQRKFFSQTEPPVTTTPEPELATATDDVNDIQLSDNEVVEAEEIAESITDSPSDAPAPATPEQDEQKNI